MSDDLAALIRDRRQQLGLTQAQLAERIGRAPSTIGSWETGRSRPGDEATVAALRRVLDLDVIDTAERVPPPPPRPAPPASEPGGHIADPPVSPVTPAATPTAVPAAAGPAVLEAPDVPPATPIRTDTDPLYRIRLVATVAAIVALGWVFAASIGAAAEILGSIADAMLAPFRA